MFTSIVSIISFAAFFAVSHACRGHIPRPVPQTFIGTVAQGCTPGIIRATSALILDPTRCDLKLEDGCDLCGLRLYIPESTTSRFLVQPLSDDHSKKRSTHVVATQCRCDEGCYFHRSSITQIGTNPLPSGHDGTAGTFSEPFACYSGISMPSLASPPTATYLIWCENDGGCSNSIVARYNFHIRFETLSPNRPAVKSNTTPKFTSLPVRKCLSKRFSKNALRFIKQGHKKAQEAPKKRSPPRRPNVTGAGYSTNFSCRRSKKIARCVHKCMRIR